MEQRRIEDERHNRWVKEHPSNDHTLPPITRVREELNLDIRDRFTNLKGMTTAEDWHKLAFESYIIGFGSGMAELNDEGVDLWKRLYDEGLTYMRNDSYLSKMGLDKGLEYLTRVCDEVAEVNK